MQNQKENSKILIEYGEENLKEMISQLLLENFKHNNHKEEK